MIFVSNLFSCFILPHRKFYFKYYPVSGKKFHKSFNQSKRKQNWKYCPDGTITYIKSTRTLRPKNSAQTVQRSSAIKVKTKLRRRKSRSYFQQIGLYDLENGEFIYQQHSSMICTYIIAMDFPQHTPLYTHPPHYLDLLRARY